MKTIGIIGFGSFGVFLAEKLDLHAKVLGYSRSGKAGKWAVSLEEVAGADYVILAVPLDAYEGTLQQLEPHLRSTTVIVDVCSVKERPMEVIKKVLLNQPVVATHPLFGPESAKDSLQGLTMVLCPENSDKKALAEVKDFSERLGLEVVIMSEQEHDKEMAILHGLTFFIAHGLKDMGLHSQKLSTPSFQKLLKLVEVEKHHSDELFYTIQSGNVHTKAVRKQFIKELESLEHSIEANH